MGAVRLERVVNDLPQPGKSQRNRSPSSLAVLLCTCEERPGSVHLYSPPFWGALRSCELCVLRAASPPHLGDILVASCAFALPLRRA